MDWQQTTLNPAGRDAFVQLIRTPPEKRSPRLIADSIAATEPLLALLDAHLAQPRLHGRRPPHHGRHPDRAARCIAGGACRVHAART